MKLTVRGTAVLAVAILAVVHGYLFGQRALNFVAMPAVAALAVGAVQLWRAEDPSIERSGLRPGFPGDRREETVSIDGRGVVTVRESLPVGIEGEPLDRTVSLPHDVTRDLVLRDRGIYRLGPPTVVQRDALGLFTRPVEPEGAGEVVVYPEVYDLSRSSVLEHLRAEQRLAGGQSFDRLREYQPGDPLRRVHWKSSAKREDLYVVEYQERRRTEPIHVDVSGQLSLADDLAAAAASVALYALEAGFEVSLSLPDEELESGRGPAHREAVLRTLAGTGDGGGWSAGTRRRAGSSGVPDDADVAIRGRASVVTVHAADREWPIEDLREPGIDRTPAPAGSIHR